MFRMQREIGKKKKLQRGQASPYHGMEQVIFEQQATLSLNEEDKAFLKFYLFILTE